MGINTYFKVDLTIGYSYVIEVVGTTTKGSETNKVSKTFKLEKEPIPNPQVGDCSCEQQMRNHNQLVQKLDSMTSMMQQVLNKVELLENRISFLENSSDRRNKRSGTKKLN